MALVIERGYERIDLEMVLSHAEVPRAEFDARFADLQRCYIQVFEENGARFDRAVFQSYEAHRRWRDGLRAAAYAAARFMRDNPQTVRFGSISMMSAGPLAQVHREAQLQRLVDLIDAGRQELNDPDALGRSVAEGVVGSIYELLISRQQAGEGTGSAEALVPDLMYIAVRPYLGHEVAREELEIQPPPEGGA